MRCVFGFLGVFALSLVLSLGCSEGGGEGGSGGTDGEHRKNKAALRAVANAT